MEKENREIILARPAWKVYESSGDDMQKRLDSCFEELQQNPFFGKNIKPLTGKLKGLYRYRVGDWRVIYKVIREQMTVEVIAILPRGDAY